MGGALAILGRRGALGAILAVSAAGAPAVSSACARSHAGERPSLECSLELNASSRVRDRRSAARRLLAGSDRT
jgi:hypothetical protein